MSKYPFKICHGSLVDVTGRPARHNDVTFVPCRVQLFGTSFSPVFEFLPWCRDHSRKLPPTVGKNEDAVWVLGRLITLFGVESTSEDERGEKCCFNAAFLANLHEHDNIAIPFECSDYYARSRLYFSGEDGPADQLQASIASAFYDLLLTEPDAVSDYEDKMWYSISGACVRFGVVNGIPYIDFESEFDVDQ